MNKNFVKLREKDFFSWNQLTFYGWWRTIPWIRHSSPKLLITYKRKFVKSMTFSWNQWKFREIVTFCRLLKFSVLGRPHKFYGTVQRNLVKLIPIFHIHLKSEKNFVKSMKFFAWKFREIKVPWDNLASVRFMSCRTLQTWNEKKNCVKSNHKTAIFCQSGDVFAKMAIFWRLTNSPSMASCSSLLLNETLPPTAAPIM